jgi:hypothetical protein
MSNQRRADKVIFGGYILDEQKTELINMAKKCGAYQSDVLKAMALSFMKLPTRKQRKLIMGVMNNED